MVDQHFKRRYDSATKHEEVSNKFGLWQLDDYGKEGTSENEAPTKRITKLLALSLPSDRNKVMQKRFLKSAISGTECALCAEKRAANRQPYYHYVDSPFSFIRAVEKRSENTKEQIQKTSLTWGRREMVSTLSSDNKQAPLYTHSRNPPP